MFWSTTPSWLSTAVAAAHPNKTAPFLRARGTDGRVARHVQSPIYVDSRVTQGLEAPPRTSTSHLATDPGSRPSAALSRSELSLATRSGPRTMEATCGNGYAPVRGMPTMMMMMVVVVFMFEFLECVIDWQKRLWRSENVWDSPFVECLHESGTTASQV